MLTGLFIASFLAATLLPGGSEIGLALMVRETHHPVVLLVLVATLGNTLGGLSSYALGWLIARRFPAEDQLSENHATAVARVRRWGAWALLLSWAPLVGDPLCVAAGWLRTALLPSVLLMTAGKAARYILIAALAT